jgi:hypothetical protein
VTLCHSETEPALPDKDPAQDAAQATALVKLVLAASAVAADVVVALAAASAVWA